MLLEVGLSVYVFGMVDLWTEALILVRILDVDGFLVGRHSASNTLRHW